MSDIALIVDHCSCCLAPVDQCEHGPPISTYEVIFPLEGVTEDAD